MRINGQQTLVERIEDIHTLQKQLTERIRLIAEQLLLDMIREAHAEQTADTEREQGDQTVEQQHAQHRPAIGAQIQTRHHDAERLSVFIAHHGVGAAVGISSLESSGFCSLYRRRTVSARRIGSTDASPSPAARS